MSDIVPRHAAPARGAQAGIKADLAKAKEGDTGYNPAGHGHAWTHGFLQLKPWHPANFRNQIKLYEAEQKAIKAAKEHELAKAEFAAEQEQMKLLSYLTPEEQNAYRARQSISFMYQRPAGYQEPSSLPVAPPAAEASTSEAPPPQEVPPEEMQQPQRWQQQGQGARPHVGNMLGAVAALNSHSKYDIVHHLSGVGRSPPRGGADPNDSNQQFVADSSGSDDELCAPGANSGSEEDKERRLVAGAEKFLRERGIDIAEALATMQKRKRDKHKKKRKKQRERD